MCAIGAYGGPHGPGKLKTRTGQIGGRWIDRLRSINSTPRVIYRAGSSLSSRRPIVELRDRSIADRQALINTCYKFIVIALETTGISNNFMNNYVTE